MTASRFRCKYCGGPVNAKACGHPLPCPNPGCPCDIGIDPYAHVYRVPEQDSAPLIHGFVKLPHQANVLDKDTGTTLSPDGTTAPERVKKAVPHVGLYAYEEVGIHGKVLDPNISRLAHAQRLLFDLYNNTNLDIHEDNCPEDDTCRCPRAMALNLVMHGWKPPKVTPAGVYRHEESYILQPFPNLRSETAPTEVVMAGQAVGKSSAPVRSALAKLRAVIDMLEAEMVAPEAATDAPPRLVVCAANRNDAGELVVGARHYDARMREQMARAGGAAAWRGCEQGFIDQCGAFLTREEAWKVAEAAGQIRRRCGGDTANGGTLFSENLY